MISQEDVRAAYRLMLGREPENEEVVATLAQTTSSVLELRERFVTSPEFLFASATRYVLRSLDWPPIEVEMDAAPSQLAAMAEHVEANWRRLGNEDPHWSVLVDDIFRASRIGETEAQFYETGRHYVETLHRTAQRCGLNLDGIGDCLELGCGVGRVTVWLAQKFPRVTAADISLPHLDLARTAVQRFGRTNVNLVHLNSMQAFESLPTFDLFTSVIVLQHNPPPIIAMLLKGLLCKLRPGGIAYFQVPTYKHDYGFTVDKYLQDAAQTQGMEMHVIPQHVLFDLLRQCGCQLLECREDGWSGDSSIISNTIFARKENGPIRTRSAKTRIRSLLDLGVGSLRGGQ